MGGARGRWRSRIHRYVWRRTLGSAGRQKWSAGPRSTPDAERVESSAYDLSLPLDRSAAATPCGWCRYVGSDRRRMFGQQTRLDIRTKPLCRLSRIQANDGISCQRGKGTSPVRRWALARRVYHPRARSKGSRKGETG
jgi:hypothetical protein